MGCGSSSNQVKAPEPASAAVSIQLSIQLKVNESTKRQSNAKIEDSTAAADDPLLAFKKDKLFQQRFDLLLAAGKKSTIKIPPFVKPGYENDYIVVVTALQLGAQLEHTLLNAYIAAYTSVKTLPEEYAFMPDGVTPNPRRAVQFEIGRQIRQKITTVATQEMLHLHWVNIILFNLDAGPAFMLPSGADRLATGGWKFDVWQVPKPDGSGMESVQIPLSSLTIDQIGNMVRWESSSEMLDPSNQGKLTATFEQLRVQMLTQYLAPIKDVISADSYAALLKLYNGTATHDVSHIAHPMVGKAPTVKAGADPVPITSFETIQQFYDFIKQYLLFADQQGWLETYRNVTGGDYDPNKPGVNQGLIQEVQNNLQRLWPIDFPDESSTDINADPPSMTFKDRAGKHLQTHVARSQTLFVPRPPYKTRGPRKAADPSTWYMQIVDVIDQIVEQGEGFSQWMEWAQAVFAGKATDADTARFYGAHITMFADVYETVKNEIAVTGPTYNFCRTRIDPSSFKDPNLTSLVTNLPLYFNSAYLGTMTMLTRLYQNAETWVYQGSPSRNAVESLGSWPIMSQGLRPLLDTMSFFTGTTTNLYLMDLTALPSEAAGFPIQELLTYFQNIAANEDLASTQQGNGYVSNVLTTVGLWAYNQRLYIENSQEMQQLQGGIPYRIMHASLMAVEALKIMNDEFPFRYYGGLSAQFPPPTTGPNVVPGVADYYASQAKPLPPGVPPNLIYAQIKEEDATLLGNAAFPTTPLYQNTFLLELKFVGNNRIQFANDPDTTQDCVGTRGILRVRAEDFPDGTNGEGQSKYFARACLLQNPVKGDPSYQNCFTRGPNMGGTTLGSTPDVGTYLTNISIKSAIAGVTPPQDPNNQHFLALSGPVTIATATVGKDFDAKQFAVDWVPNYNENRNACFQGYNQVVCMPLETIDPHALKISVGSDPNANLYRGIYNGANPNTPGPFILDYTSLERGCLMRGAGSVAPLTNLTKDGVPSVYSWAVDYLPAPWSNYANNPTKYPDITATFNAYYNDRCTLLSQQVDANIQTATTRWQIDQVISWTERFLYIYKQNMTMASALHDSLLLGQSFHTMSGNMNLPPDPTKDTLLQLVQSKLGVTATYVNTDTHSNLGLKWQPNNRWTIDYGMSLLDVDTMGSMMWGTVTIPITVSGMTETFVRSFNPPPWASLPADLWTNPPWTTVESEVHHINLEQRVTVTTVPNGLKPSQFKYTDTQVGGPTSGMWTTAVGSDMISHALSYPGDGSLCWTVTYPSASWVNSGSQAVVQFMTTLATWWNSLDPSIPKAKPAAAAAPAPKK